MKAYADHPARRRVAQVPRSKKLPDQIGSWCHQIPEEQRGTYPIDQSDGGEDDDPVEHAAWARELKAMGRNPRAPWKQQTDLLDIEEQDYISDNGEEIWSVMEQRGIQNVILLGVHTNMCVLGRPFGLRQMAKNGKHVVLMRDMTDTMYNPLRAPYVSHFSGTDLIVDHIEKFVCPTITSDQILGGNAFRFQHDRRKHIVIVMAEREYETQRTLPEFAVQSLGKHFRISYVFANDKQRNDLPGIAALRDADVMLVSVRRRVLPPDQMALVRAHVAQGKPVVGIRTASHAFSLRNQPIPAGLRDWPDFDQAVFGGNYTGHHGSGPDVVLKADPAAATHPVLAGVDCAEFVGKGSLYRVSPLAASTQVLVAGTIPDKPGEPIAWLNKRQDGGQSFYTSLGHPDDFKQKAFRSLLRNALYWSSGVPVADVVPPGR
ncbi:MAG: ThuA domain-containing protein, partial [Planctomycetaceae bacterium]